MAQTKAPEAMMTLLDTAVSSGGGGVYSYNALTVYAVIAFTRYMLLAIEQR